MIPKRNRESYFGRNSGRRNKVKRLSAVGFVLLILMMTHVSLVQAVKTSALSAKQQTLNLSIFSAYRYVVSVEQLPKNDEDPVITIKWLERLQATEGYYLYSVSLNNDDDEKTKTEVIRIGFFSGKKAAKKLLKKIDNITKNKYKISLARIPKKEKSYLTTWVLKNNKQAENKLSKAEKKIKNLELMMERARQAMIKNDYRRAISSYTKVLTIEPSNYFQAALEYLGLARERNQQYAHAKAEYERYLRLYPEGEGADRVQQRLTVLLSAAFEPKKKLRKSRIRRKRSAWRSFGSIYQSYRQDLELNQQTGENRELASAYSSFFYSSKLKQPGFEMKNQISISNSQDLSEYDEDNDLVKISTLYSQMYSKRLKISSRIGRQSQSSSGAYGRFDGATLTYHYNANVFLRAVSGFPVDFDTYDSVQQNKRFYSANIEVESFLGYLDVNSYFITQYFDDVLDRQALGLEVRHFDRKLTFFTTLDYDFSYSLLNNLVTNVSYKILPAHTVSTYLTFRRSPLITTTNALQGQSVSSLDELLKTKTRSELRELAKNRTAKYVSSTFSWRHQLNKKFEMDYDYTLSQLSGTPASEDISAVDGTGYEHYFSIQAIANDIFREYDINIAGIRYEKRNNSNRTTFNLLRRDRFSKKYLISTKFRLDYQQRDDGSVIYDIRPSGKVAYKMSRRYKFEFELGIQRRIRENTFDADSETNGFISLGYFAQF